MNLAKQISFITEEDAFFSEYEFTEVRPRPTFVQNGNGFISGWNLSSMAFKMDHKHSDQSIIIDSVSDFENLVHLTNIPKSMTYRQLCNRVVIILSGAEVGV